MYRRFNALSEERQQYIKFRSTDSLHSYIMLKRQLGLQETQKLFESTETEENYALQLRL